MRLQLIKCPRISACIWSSYAASSKYNVFMWGHGLCLYLSMLWSDILWNHPLGTQMMDLLIQVYKSRAFNHRLTTLLPHATCIHPNLLVTPTPHLDHLTPLYVLLLINPTPVITIISGLMINTTLAIVRVIIPSPASNLPWTFGSNDISTTQQIMRCEILLKMHGTPILHWSLVTQIIIHVKLCNSIVWSMAFWKISWIWFG